MFYENFNRVLKEKGITNKRLAEFITESGRKISKESIAKYRDGSRTPDPDVISLSAELAGVQEQIFFSDDYYDAPIQLNGDYIELPTIHAGAGAIGYAVDIPEQRAYPKDLIPPQVALDENVLVIVVAGNSMEPLYYENDVVFIDMVNGRDFIQVDGTYLVRYGDTVQIKDVSFLGNGDIMISSRNNNQRIKIKEDLGIDDWEIVGKPYVQLHATVGSKLLIEEMKGQL